MDLNMHAALIPPIHQDLAQFAIIDSEIQVDIRDALLGMKKVLCGIYGSMVMDK